MGREPGIRGLLSSSLPSVHRLSDLGHSPHLLDIHLGAPRAPSPSSLSALMLVMGILEGRSRSVLTRPVPVVGPRRWACGTVLPEGSKGPGDEGHPQLSGDMRDKDLEHWLCSQAEPGVGHSSPLIAMGSCLTLSLLICEMAMTTPILPQGG